jgi:hypothetical protein
MNFKTFGILFLLMFFVTACPGPTDGGKDGGNGDVITQPLPDPNDPGTVIPSGPNGEPPIVEPAPSEPLPPTPAPVPPTSEVPPDRADTLKFHITYPGTSKYDTSARKAKYDSVLPRCKRIVSSKKFHDMILAHKFTTTSRSASYVYENILDANEKLQPTKDNEIDMGVKFYYAATTIIGYTNGGITYINVNTKYFDTYNEVSVCSNLMHEYMHKLGYDHSSAKDYNSVPYFVGTAVKETAKTIK